MNANEENKLQTQICGGFFFFFDLTKVKTFLISQGERVWVSGWGGRDGGRGRCTEATTIPSLHPTVVPATDFQLSFPLQIFF